MTTTAREDGEGWGWPPSSRKAHFITKDGRSLCGRVGFAFDLPLDPADKPSPDDCAECTRRLAKRVQA